VSERGVCICPDCGCQFSDDQKAKYERMALREDWTRRPLYRLRVWRLARRLSSKGRRS
jgi:hypothetical protein